MASERALALLVALIPAVSAAEERLVDRVAVVVNDDVIALSELYAFAGETITTECLPPAVYLCRREYLGEAADVLIRRSLQRAELQRLGDIAHGLAGPEQRADDEIEVGVEVAHPGHGLGDGAGLAVALAVQLDVGPALDQSLDVPVRLAVADEIDGRPRLTHRCR